MEQLRAGLLDSCESEDVNPPLAVLYSRCHLIHTQQDRLVASRDFDLINAAIALLSRTELAIESVGIFSANEDKDDLATADIKYLLVPFYRASLLSAAPVRTDASPSSASASPSAARLAAVNRALPALGSFLQRCEQYGLLGALGASGLDAAAGGSLDPAAKRSFKVEKFKRERALNAALGALEARRAAAAAREAEDEAGTSANGSAAAAAAAAAAASSAAGGSSGGSGGASAGPSPALGGTGIGGGPLDEEDERQLWVWRLELAVLGALDMQAALKQEAELLQHAATREAAAAAAGPGPSSSAAARGAGSGAQQGAADEAAKAALMAKLRGICRDLDGNRREQMRRDVFKPGHILPTLTVEEAGEIERREAEERETRQRRAEEKERERRAALDSDEEDAEDKAKQRAWDDWRDAHPKGYGNSKLRPCG